MLLYLLNGYLEPMLWATLSAMLVGGALFGVQLLLLLRLPLRLRPVVRRRPASAITSDTTTTTTTTTTSLTTTTTTTPERRRRRHHEMAHSRRSHACVLVATLVAGMLVNQVAWHGLPAAWSWPWRSFASASTMATTAATTTATTSLSGQQQQHRGRVQGRHGWPLERLHGLAPEYPFVVTLLVVTTPRRSLDESRQMLASTVHSYLAQIPRTEHEPLYQRVRMMVYSPLANHTAAQDVYAELQSGRWRTTSHDQQQQPQPPQEQQPPQPPLPQFHFGQGVGRDQTRHFADALAWSFQDDRSLITLLIEDDFPLCADKWHEMMAVLGHAFASTSASSSATGQNTNNIHDDNQAAAAATACGAFVGTGGRWVLCLGGVAAHPPPPPPPPYCTLSIAVALVSAYPRSLIPVLPCLPYHHHHHHHHHHHDTSGLAIHRDAAPAVLSVLRRSAEFTGASAGAGAGASAVAGTDIHTDTATGTVGIPTDLLVQDCLLGRPWLSECRACRNSLVISRTLVMEHVGHASSTYANRTYSADSFTCDWRHPFHGYPDVTVY